MSILIVGGDKIDSLNQKLTDSGATRITHWTARKKNVTKRDIPKHIDIAVLFTDFINHSVARKIKTEVKKRGIPAFFCKRSWSELQHFVKSFVR
jgi:hypothetical protein